MKSEIVKLKFVFVAGFIVVFFLFCRGIKWVTSTEYERTGVLLSELSEEECMTFILDKGISIYPEFKEENIRSQVKWFIVHAEREPKTRFDMYSNFNLINLGEKIRREVNIYYGADGGEYLYVKKNNWPENTEMIYYS